MSDIIENRIRHALQLVGLEPLSTSRPNLSNLILEYTLPYFFFKMLKEFEWKITLNSKMISDRELGGFDWSRYISDIYFSIVISRDQFKWTKSMETINFTFTSLALSQSPQSGVIHKSTNTNRDIKILNGEECWKSGTFEFLPHDYRITLVFDSEYFPNMIRETTRKCSFCNLSMELESLKHHMAEECDLRIVELGCSCPNSGRLVAFIVAKEHLCPNKRMNCPNGCGVNEERYMMGIHLENRCSRRLIRRDCDCGNLELMAREWDQHKCWKERCCKLEKRIEDLEKQVAELRMGKK